MKKDLKTIFENNYNPLCNYAMGFLPDRSTSEDVVQTVFIQLWQNEKIFNLEEPLPFLMRCVKYKCIDFARTNRRKREIPSDILPNLIQTTESELKEEDIKATLQFFASQLPPKMKKVFLMSRSEGKSYAEIAEELNISINTVENHMGAALKRMRILLKKHNYLPVLAFVLN